MSGARSVNVEKAFSQKFNLSSNRNQIGLFDLATNSIEQPTKTRVEQNFEIYSVKLLNHYDYWKVLQPPKKPPQQVSLLDLLEFGSLLKIIKIEIQLKLSLSKSFIIHHACMWKL